MVLAQGKDVTVEDGTDSPAEPPIFKAQPHVSYSRLHIHVNGGTSSSNLDTLTGFTTRRKLNALAATAFSFYRWWPWPSTEHRANVVARLGITFSPLNLFLTI